MDYIKIILKNIWQFAIDNSNGIIKALVAIWYFFAGIHMYIYAVIALSIVDVITGVLASSKRGEKFTSKKLKKGLLVKFALYLVLILTVFVLDLITKSVFHHEDFYFSFLITFLISTYEVVSILENINTIKPDIPFMSALVSIFKKMGEKSIEKMEERVDDVVDTVTDFKKVTENKDEKKEEETESGQDFTTENPEVAS